jgi:hypothetical protein
MHHDYVLDRVIMRCSATPLPLFPTTPFMVFNVTYYLELHITITLYCWYNFLLSKGFNLLQCLDNQSELFSWVKD